MVFCFINGSPIVISMLKGLKQGDPSHLGLRNEKGSSVLSSCPTGVKDSNKVEIKEGLHFVKSFMLLEVEGD